MSFDEWPAELASAGLSSKRISGDNLAKNKGFLFFIRVVWP